MKNVLWAFAVLIGGLLTNACQGLRTYPATPSIEFTKFQLDSTYDDSTLRNPIKLVEIFFKFVDGDGDLFTSDTSVRSLYLTFYKNGIDSFVKIPDSTLFSKPTFSFPYGSVMDRNGQNKTQKGTIQFNYPFYYPMPYDTIEVEFYVVDVAGNKSNVVRTSKIPLK